MTIHMRAISCFTLATTLLVSGCIPYPVYKTLQPAARMTVLSYANEPLLQAEVTLIADAFPACCEMGRSTKLTLANGVASFDSVREWTMEVVFLHGSLAYYWNWCVRKEGYVTYFTRGSSNEFQSTMVVKLEAGASIPCPESFR